jgi:hypothetical protein
VSACVPDLDRRLSEGARAARALGGAATPAQGADDAAAFLSAVYHLGRAVECDPPLRSSPPAVSFVEQTSVDAVAGRPALVFWTIKFETRMSGTWEWDWAAACERRSSLEFLLDLYTGSALAEVFGELDPEDIDDQLRHWARFEGYLPAEAIPDGIPASHWWWWAPERMGPDA